MPTQQLKNGHATDLVPDAVASSSPHFTRIDDDVVDEILAVCHPPSVKLYLYLARRANKDGVCHPAIDTMVEETSMPRTTVKRALDELESGGWVTRSERRTRSGVSVTSEYLLSKEYPRTYEGSKASPNHNQTVTKPSPNTPPLLDPKEDVGEYVEEDKVIPPVGPPGGTRRKPSHPLPDDFSLTDRMKGFATDRGLMNGEVESCFEKFTNHAVANDRRQVDWEAAWRQWVLRDLEYRGKSRASGDTDPKEEEFVRAWLEREKRKQVAFMGEEQSAINFPHLARLEERAARDQYRNQQPRQGYRR